MLVQIRDRAALSSLPSTNLHHYLKTHGWEDAGRWGKRATIHKKKYGKRNWEILIPLSDTVADYAESMAESIAILATVEDRSQLDVFYDVLEAGPGEAQELAKAINGQKRQAEEAMQKVRQNPAVFPLDRAISEADSLQRGGKIEEAIEKWRSIANVSEGIDNELAAHAWFSVGYLLTEGDVEVDKKNNIQEAISVYDRVLSLKSDFAEAYYNRGIAKGNLGNHEAAIADFDQAIHLKSDYADAYYNRGIAKFILGKYQAAITDDDQVILLRPDYFEAYYNRGIARFVLGEYQAAIADYDLAIDLNPDHAEAYYNRGNANAILDRKAEARADFETALDLAVRSENTALKSRIEQQLQGLMDTVSVSNSIRKTKDLLRSQLGYDPLKETLSDLL